MCPNKTDNTTLILGNAVEGGSPTVKDSPVNITITNNFTITINGGLDDAEVLAQLLRATDVSWSKIAESITQAIEAGTYTVSFEPKHPTIKKTTIFNFLNKRQEHD